MFSGTVEEQHVPYMNPSENGGKADVRWMALRRGEQGAGLLLQAEAGTMFQVRQTHLNPMERNRSAVDTAPFAIRVIMCVQLEASPRVLGCADIIFGCSGNGRGYLPHRCAQGSDGGEGKNYKHVTPPVGGEISCDARRAAGRFVCPLASIFPA